MSNEALNGLFVLVAEDEPITAIDLADTVTAAGASVVGPVSTLGGAITLLERDCVDAAILDVRLNGALVCAAADMLIERGVPFIFYTAWDIKRIPPEYRHVPICEKPADTDAAVALLAKTASDARG